MDRRERGDLRRQTTRAISLFGVHRLLRSYGTREEEGLKRRLQNNKARERKGKEEKISEVKRRVVGSSEQSTTRIFRMSLTSRDVLHPGGWTSVYRPSGSDCSLDPPPSFLSFDASSSPAGLSTTQSDITLESLTLFPPLTRSRSSEKAGRVRRSSSESPHSVSEGGGKKYRRKEEGRKTKERNYSTRTRPDFLFNHHSAGGNAAKPRGMRRTSVVRERSEFLREENEKERKGSHFASCQGMTLAPSLVLTSTSIASH